MENKKIVIVDDEIIILKSLEKGLCKRQYDVLTFTNGYKALEAIENQPVNLIITDIIMDEINGIQLLKKIKEINPELPVIMITGYGELSSAIEAMRNGADDYLLKPCNLDELIFSVQNSLEKQELRAKIKLYEKILPVCSYCKKIRDDEGKAHGTGKWMDFQEFLHKKTGILPSHGMCPDCYEKFKKGILEV